MSLWKDYLEKTPHQKVNPNILSYLANIDSLLSSDPKIASALLKELQAQRNSLKMIASENYSSFPVQLAMGNLLTDKYAEGHPHHRFYSGCESVDAIESLGVEYAKELFGAEHAYIQPHSGADANLIAYWAILIKEVETRAIDRLGRKTVFELSPEEYESIRQEFSKQRLLGMSLESGGHLTHGSRVNLSSKMFQITSYGVDPKTHLINYKEIEALALKVKPLILLAGYSAYSRLIDFSILREIADKVGAVFMVDMAHFAGLVAGKAMTGKYNPVPYADIVTSTTHKTLRGPRGGLILCKEAFKPFIDKGCPYAMGGPLPHVMAAKAIAFKEALQPEFQTYAKEVIANAQALSNRLQALGCSVLTGGTDNHLILIDVQKNFNLTGRQAENALFSVGLSLNRNTIPNDPNGPWYCAGIRLGTAALTTRGLKKREMEKIADILYDVLKGSTPFVDPVTHAKNLSKVVIDAQVKERAEREIRDLLEPFPLYPELEIKEKV